MAIKTWKGGATRVSQVATWTISSNTNGHTFILSVTHPSGVPTDTVEIVNETADGVLTTTQIASNIATEWNASNHDFAAAVTAQASSNVVTFTADVAGVPFIISKSGTGTSTLTTTTANSGPNDYGVPSNWAEGAIPIATNDVRITGNVDILYGLNQSSVALDDVIIEGFTGRIGEQSHLLAFDPATLTIDCTGNVHLLLGSVTTVRVLNTGSGHNSSGFGCFLVGAGTTTTLELIGGSTNVSQFHDANMTIGTCHIEGGRNYIGPNITLTTFRQTGGDNTLEGISGATVTTITVDGGDLFAHGAFATTTGTQNGGNVTWEVTGACTTYNARGGLLDLLFSKKTKEITTIVQNNCTIRYDKSFLTNTTWTENVPMEKKPALSSAGKSVFR